MKFIRSLAELLYGEPNTIDILIPWTAVAQAVSY